MAASRRSAAACKDVGPESWLRASVHSLDSWWLHRSLDWITGNPGACAHVLKIKLEAFWSWDLNPKTLGQTGAKETLYTITYLPLLVVGLAGLVLGLRTGRGREVAFLALILGMFTLIHVLVVGYTRLRAPLDPLLMASASLMLVRVYAFARERMPVGQPRGLTGGDHA